MIEDVIFPNIVLGVVFWLRESENVAAVVIIELFVMNAVNGFLEVGAFAKVNN